MIRHGAPARLRLRRGHGPSVLCRPPEGVRRRLHRHGLPSTGNDLCFAWPTAEISVMGAPGAVSILHGKRLAALDVGDRRGRGSPAGLGLRARYLNTRVAAERGVIDAVIDPADTRWLLAGPPGVAGCQGPASVRRRHGNTPL